MEDNLREVKTTTLTNEVLEVNFSIDVAGEIVPCVIWAPSDSAMCKTLIVMGHGGSQHKKTQAILDRAMRYAVAFGWSSIAIDAPNHGDRITREEAEAQLQKTQRRIRGGDTSSSLSPSDKIAFLDKLAAQAVPEWRSAIDTAIAHFVPGTKSIAYWGVSQGTSIGVPLLAEDQRFKCAVLGLAQLHPEHIALRHAAERISIPLRFAFQWDDPIREREYGIELFNAFASNEKSMHINPGGHTDIPETESESWDLFFRRYLELG